MDERNAGKFIALFLGLLMPPVAIYLLWKIERDQANAVLDNIRREARWLAVNGSSAQEQS